jgi:hypothetical protein
MRWRRLRYFFRWEYRSCQKQKPSSNARLVVTGVPSG